MTEPVRQEYEDNKPRELSTEAARQAETPHVARYVLGASTALIVGIFAVWWLLGT